jgi:sigma-E factor negative regulatory protein RseB
MNRQADAWVTLMGDVPAPTLRLFAEALEHRK